MAQKKAAQAYHAASPCRLAPLTRVIRSARWVKRKKSARTFRIRRSSLLVYASLAHQGDAVTLTFTATFFENFREAMKTIRILSWEDARGPCPPPKRAFKEVKRALQLPHSQPYDPTREKMIVHENPDSQSGKIWQAFLWDLTAGTSEADHAKLALQSGTPPPLERHSRWR